MRNIHITELMTKRNLSVFPLDSSLKQLIGTIRKGWKINLFYLVDSEGRLKGIIPRKKILEYLCPFFYMVEKEQLESLDTMIGSVEAIKLAEPEFSSLTMDKNLPDALNALLLSDHTTLPVLDFEGKLLGEITEDTLLGTLSLENKEFLNAVS